MTASFVWDRCDGRCTVSEIAEQVADAFGTNPGASVEAVTAALRRFAELGLLEQRARLGVPSEGRAWRTPSR